MFAHNKMIDRLKIFALVAVLVLFGGTGNAWAACSNPTAEEGSIIYNSDFKVAQFCNGTNWISMADTGVMTDTLAGLSCTIDQVAAWDGSAWVCVAAPTNVLGDLNCVAGQIPSWSGTNWVCANDTGGTNGGGGAIGDSSIYNLTFTAGTPGTPGSGGETVDDVFSTDLYMGNGASQTITNGIDLSGEGGLVWIKNRSETENHRLHDTERGFDGVLQTSGQSAVGTGWGTHIQSESSGFSLGAAHTNGALNDTGENYVAWTFRESPKFFDIVTYTGDGVAGRTIPHDLGVEPGMVIVKSRTSSTNWMVFHRGDGTGHVLFLNLTSDESSTPGPFFGTGPIFVSPTDTGFTIGTSSAVNAVGDDYVAYIFAHDPDPDGVIQCGSYTGNSSNSGPVVTLGWEPQWLMIKNVTSSGWWRIFDSERGISRNVVRAEDSAAELDLVDPRFSVSSSGFQIIYGPDSDINHPSGAEYIYCAIRDTGGVLTSASAGTPGTPGTIVDSDGLGTLSSLIVTGDSFSISGSASNDRVFTASDMPDANTIEVPQTVTSEGPVSVTITKQGSSGTLGGLVCADGQVMKWSDSANRWTCVNEIGGADNLGDHTATRDIDAAGNKVTSAIGVVYNGIGGGQPGQAIGVGGSGNIQAGVKLVATEGAACSDIGKMAKTTGGQLLVCEGSSEITNESCAGFNEGAIAFSSGGTMHLCLD